MSDTGDIHHVLECSLCLEGFKEPKILPCFHTFCLKCLKAYVTVTATNNSFVCPLCRKAIDTPEGGVEEFQNNFYIQGIKTRKTDCDLCEHPSVSFCTDCDEYYCNTCMNAHSRMKISRDHRLVDLKMATDWSEIKFKKTTYCQHHRNEQVKIICKDCNELVCVICQLTKHDKHRCAGLAAEADEKRKQLSTLIEQLSENDEQMGSQLKMLDEIETKYEELAKKQKTDLSKFADEAVWKIHEKGRSLQRVLVERKKNSLKDIKTTRKVIKAKNTAAETLVASLESAFEKCSDADILTIYGHVAVHVDSEVNPYKAKVYHLEEMKYFDLEWIGKITRREILLQEDQPNMLTDPVTPPQEANTAGDYSGTCGDRQRSAFPSRSELHGLISSPEASNDAIIDWINKNVDEAGQQDGSFIQEIATTVFHGALTDSGGERSFDVRKLVYRKQLLQRLCTGKPELEYPLLKSVQSLIPSLDNPPGLLQSIYWTLYKEGIVSRAGFLQLKNPEKMLAFSGVAKDVLTHLLNRMRQDC